MPERGEPSQHNFQQSEESKTQQPKMPEFEPFDAKRKSHLLQLKVQDLGAAMTAGQEMTREADFIAADLATDLKLNPRGATNFWVWKKSGSTLRSVRDNMDQAYIESKAGFRTDRIADILELYSQSNRRQSLMESPVSVIRLAEIYAMQEREDTAANILDLLYTDFVARRHSNPRDWFELAKLADRLDDTHRAKNCLEQAWDNFFSGPEAYRDPGVLQDLQEMCAKYKVTLSRAQYEAWWFGKGSLVEAYAFALISLQASYRGVREGDIEVLRPALKKFKDITKKKENREYYRQMIPLIEDIFARIYAVQNNPKEMQHWLNQMPEETDEDKFVKTRAMAAVARILWQREDEERYRAQRKANRLPSPAEAPPVDARSLPRPTEGQPAGQTDPSLPVVDDRSQEQRDQAPDEAVIRNRDRTLLDRVRQRLGLGRSEEE